MSRAVIQESFGGPEVLEVHDVAEPHAAPGEVRVRVSAAGLNPVDWKIAASAEAAGRYGITLPAGFGNDFAGVVDEAGDGVTGFAAGDRVYGGARGRAVADYAVVRPGAARFSSGRGVFGSSASAAAKNRPPPQGPGTSALDGRSHPRLRLKRQLNPAGNGIAAAAAGL